MRTFIAIELPREFKDAMGSLQDKLKESGADVKWVEPRNIHLTLKFLGEVEEKKIDAVTAAMEETVKDKSPFHLNLSSLGAFPKINLPRVIWTGLSQGDRETKEIAKILENKMQKLGIPAEERKFSSHITIGRVRSGLNRDKLVNILNNLINKGDGSIFSRALVPEKIEPSPLLVTKIALYKSTLTPKGPVYEVLKEAYLKTS